MGRIVVLISGSGTNLQALMDAASDGRISGEIVSVISNRPNAYGLERARASGIPTQTLPYGPYKERGASREDYDADLSEMVDSQNPDLIVLAGWMRILTPAFIDRFADRLINLHPALPGAYPGKNAIERAWKDACNGGSQTSGVMIHRVIAEVDAGTVLGVKEVTLDPDELLDAFTARMHAAEHVLLVETVAQLLAPK